MTDEPKPIPVFWSGGMDSSFRVLDLVIHYECRVSPVYVRDPDRKSVPNELVAMQRIRDRLRADFPEASKRLEPLNIIERDEIILDPEITRKYYAMRAIEETPWQFEWLANVPGMIGCRRVELCSKGAKEPLKSLKPLAAEIYYPGGAHSYRIQPWDYANAYEEGFSLYDHFSFPILFYEKSDLEASAQDHGFADLLQLAWFCHYPWGKSPCGACSVCRYFMLENTLIALPIGTRFRHIFWYLVHPSRLLVTHPERFIQRIRDYATWYMVKRRST